MISLNYKMCGINTIFNLQNNLNHNELTEKILLMNSCLDHRGPDSNDHYIDEKGLIAMGNTRLSITGDFNRSNQPYLKNNNIIVFNGEIYNFKDLELELFNKVSNYSNTSDSDTEFLLNLYNYYGDKYFYKLDGMFSFIIWDSTNRKALICKDFFGKKPLYFSSYNNNIYFSSEISALKKVIPVEHFKLKDKSVIEYINFGYSISDNTIYEKVHRVKKNSKIFIDPTGFKSNEKIYENDYFYQSNNDLGNNDFDIVFSNAVSKRVKNLNNFNLLFSGGIDSSLILSEIIKSNKKFQCLYITNQQIDKKYMELINSLKIELNVYDIDSENQFELFQNIIKKFSEPNSDISILPTYIAYSKCNDKVAINGDGGDELFLGYRRHSLSFILNKFNFISKIPLNRLIDNKLFNSLSQNQFDNIKNLSGHFFTKKEKRLFHDYNLLHEVSSKEFNRNLRNKNNFINQIQFDLDNQLTNCLMTKTDMCSMINSIEARSPFLDIELFKFSNNIFNGTNHLKLLNKRFLRNQLKKRMNNNLYKMPKVGFALSKPDFYKNNKKKLEEFIFENNSTIFDFINKKNLIDYLNKNNSLIKSDLIWMIYSFMCWEKLS